jgi:hypothetical protein
MALRGGEPAVLELPDLMTLKNVARLLGESLSTTRHRHHRGELGGFDAITAEDDLRGATLGQQQTRKHPPTTQCLKRTEPSKLKGSSHTHR